MNITLVLCFEHKKTLYYIYYNKQKDKYIFNRGKVISSKFYNACKDICLVSFSLLLARMSCIRDSERGLTSTTVGPTTALNHMEISSYPVSSPILSITYVQEWKVSHKLRFVQEQSISHVGEFSGTNVDYWAASFLSKSYFSLSRHNAIF